MEGLAITSLDKGWIAADDSICMILGRSTAELQALTWDIITHTDDLFEDCYNFDRLLRQDINSYQMEKRFILPSGQSSNALLTVTCQRGVSEWPEYIFASIKSSEDILQAAERLILQSRVRTRLNEKERTVLYLVGQGMPTKLIADRMCLCNKSIEAYRSGICLKLEVRNLAGLVRCAVLSEYILRGSKP